MARKFKKKRRIRRNLTEVIQTSSSKRLADVLSKLSSHPHIKSQVQEELIARDLKRGGPHKTWGHG